MCWNKGRLCWKTAKLFYFCHIKKLVRPETFGPYYVCRLRTYVTFLLLWLDALSASREKHVRKWRYVIWAAMLCCPVREFVHPDDGRTRRRNSGKVRPSHLAAFRLVTASEFYIFRCRFKRRYKQRSTGGLCLQRTICTKWFLSYEMTQRTNPCWYNYFENCNTFRVHVNI